MNRHAVHMQADINKSWRSAERWHKTPVVRVIVASEMYKEGYKFDVTGNEVWCIEKVTVEYIGDMVYNKT